MKKKVLLPLGLSLMAIPAAVCFVACGGNNQSSNRVSAIYLNDGVEEDSYLSYEYNYGEKLDCFENLKIVVNYNDGKKADLEESQYENVTITYKKDGEPIELDSIGVHTVLDCGFYQIQITYEGRTATLNLAIEQTSTTDMNYQIYVREQGTNVLPAPSTFKFGTTQTKNEEVQGEEGVYYRQWIESPYEVVVLKNGKYFKTKDIEGVYLITQEEREEYDALETFEEKQEYLNGRANIHYEENGVNYFENRSILGNSTDTVSDTAYVLDANWMKPGNYYAFARIDDDNHLPLYTAPQSRVLIQKGTFSFKESLCDFAGVATKDEMLNSLQLHADYDFHAYNEDVVLNAVALKDIAIRTADDIPDTYYSYLNDGYRQIMGWGHFEFKNKYTRVNSLNNGQTFPAVFVLEDGAEYYNVDPNEEFDVVLNIKGSDVYLYTEEYEVEYEYKFGDEITPNINGYRPELFDVVGGQISATNIGSYYVDLKLKDEVNYHIVDITEYNPSGDYVFQGFTHSDNETIPEGAYRFNYSIVKRTTSEADNPYSIKFNDEVIEGYSNVMVKAGDKIKLELNDRFYTTRDKNNISWNVRLPSYIDANQVINDDKLSYEITINAVNSTDTGESINFRVEFAEDEALDSSVIDVDLWIYREWSEELKTAIYGSEGEVPATFNDEDGKYYTNRELIIRYLEYGIEGLNLPESDLGVWEVNADYYSDESGETFRNFRYTFRPNDNSYKEIEIYAHNVSVRYTPDYSVPTNLIAVYGQRLSEIELPEGFTWQAGDTVINGIGECEYQATYTPADLEQFYVVKDISITVNVQKADPDYTVPTGLTATYGQTLADVELPEGFTWQGDPSTNVGEPGEREFYVTYIPYEGYYYNTITDIKVTVTVSKINPEYTAPTDLNATYGQTLSDIKLPEGFTWQDDLSTPVGNTGTYNYFNVTYTPVDTMHYNVVENIQVSVWVKKAQQKTIINKFKLLGEEEWRDENNFTFTFGQTIVLGAVYEDGSVPEGSASFYLDDKDNSDGRATIEGNELTITRIGVVYFKSYINESTNYYADFSKENKKLVFTKADENVEITSDLSRAYNSYFVADPEYTKLGNGDVKVEFKLVTESDEYYSDVHPSNVGNYVVRVSVYNSTNHFDGFATREFTISKVDPDYEVPTLEARKGTTLEDVPLPEGFSWKTDPTTNVGEELVTKQYLLTYTPADTDNYNIIDNIEVNVTVVEKDLAAVTITNIASLSKTYDGYSSLGASYTTNSTGYVNVTYRKDGDPISKATKFSPTNAGSYIVRVEVESDSTYYTNYAETSFIIAKAAPTEAPTEVYINYGDTLSSINLPDGWTYGNNASERYITVADLTTNYTSDKTTYATQIENGYVGEISNISINYVGDENHETQENLDAQPKIIVRKGNRNLSLSGDPSSSAYFTFIKEDLEGVNKFTFTNAMKCNTLYNYADENWELNEIDSQGSFIYNRIPMTVEYKLEDASEYTTTIPTEVGYYVGKVTLDETDYFLADTEEFGFAIYNGSIEYTYHDTENETYIKFVGIFGDRGYAYYCDQDYTLDQIYQNVNDESKIKLVAPWYSDETWSTRDRTAMLFVEVSGQTYKFDVDYGDVQEFSYGSVQHVFYDETEGITYSLNIKLGDRVCFGYNGEYTEEELKDIDFDFTRIWEYDEENKVLTIIEKYYERGSLINNYRYFNVNENNKLEEFSL